MSAWPQDGDNEEARALVRRARLIDEGISTLHVKQRAIEVRLDEIRREARPEFPTPEQIAGLAEATRRMGELEVPSSHHGDPTPTYAVVVDGARRWLNIRHGAPPSARNGERLWDFTDEEIEAFLDILKGEDHCWTILRWWRCDGGISVEVR